MKLYIVYFRTMQDSPEVTIKCATTSKAVAELQYEKAKAEEAEWMADEDEDSGNWAEACIRFFEKGDGSINPGDTIHVAIETIWEEEVTTQVRPFIFEKMAQDFVDVRRSQLRTTYPGLAPFDEDETIEESMHLEDPDVAVDVYFDIVDVKVQ